jgi:hypothetical protein
MNLSQTYKGNSTPCPKFKEQDIVALEDWGVFGQNFITPIKGEDKSGEGENENIDNYCRTQGSIFIHINPYTRDKDLKLIHCTKIGMNQQATYRMHMFTITPSICIIKASHLLWPWLDLLKVKHVLYGLYPRVDNILDAPRLWV